MNTQQNLPRPEHPNPQLERSTWLNLNGEWDFAFDFSRSGKARKMYENGDFSQKILVPFCPESTLSGIGFTDFIPAVWYRRQVTLSPGQLSGHSFLHIGAADYRTTLYINGQEAGTHAGGYASFQFEITDYLSPGDNEFVIYVEDDIRSPLQPRGKQSEELYSHHCDYTRTTGIWQTVWLEFTPSSYIRSLRLTPDLGNASLHISALLNTASGAGQTFRAAALWHDQECGSVSASVPGYTDTLDITLPLSELHLWEAEKGGLYRLRLQYGADCVESYFGMRQVCLRNRKFLLNGKPLFLRTVLDQGFYPDGIYTARDEEALIKDIRLSMEMGFNGARLHEKVFEPRFLYHCDRLGYLVWGEYANWGLDLSNPLALHTILPEWMEILERDRNHPSIIGWCPFNETWDYDGRSQIDDTIRQIYQLTRIYDPTRPCIDTSGNYHTDTDIYDLHNYIQDVEEFRACYQDFGRGGKLVETMEERQHYDYDKLLPVYISEYGGIKWDVEHKLDAAWGYGDAPQTMQEFLERYEGLTGCLLQNPNIMGFCYTQLYDVEQETNGLYTYERRPKFDPELICRINRQPAAVEAEIHQAGNPPLES